VAICDILFVPIYSIGGYFIGSYSIDGYYVGG
jgi:hypothetical protein